MAIECGVRHNSYSGRYVAYTGSNQRASKCLFKCLHFLEYKTKGDIEILNWVVDISADLAKRTESRISESSKKCDP